MSHIYYVYIQYVYAREQKGEERSALLYIYIVTIYANVLVDSSSSSQAVRIHAFSVLEALLWGRPEGRGGIVSVAYFQNLSSLAGFTKVTYPSFNKLTTLNCSSFWLPLIKKGHSLSPVLWP